MNALDFGQALTELKKGKKLQRQGWNGKGMFVYYVPAASYPAMTEVAKSIQDENGNVSYNPYLALKTVDGTISCWIPSIMDLFAEDWIILK